MSRTPGASALLDVRTTAILKEYVLATNKCAPGADKPWKNTLAECNPPACGYDRPKDMLAILGAMIVIATALGIMHSYAVFLPTAAIHYNSGFLELCLIAAMMYLVMLLTTCAAYPIIEYAGHRLTALFGMIFVFIGTLLDSQVFDTSMLYVSHIVLVGIGAGLAYAASMSLPSDLFRVKLSTTLMIVNIAGSLGTIFFTCISIEALDLLGYKWTKFMLAVLVLFFTLAIHVYPKTSIMYATKCDPSTGVRTDKGAAIRECVYRVNENEKLRKSACDTDRNMLCVCVCDLRLYSDKSFLLWAILMMVATMTFYLPYLFIMSFAETVDAPISEWYIVTYCIASIATRCAFIASPDFTFPSNRVLFQVCTLVSGVLWILINWTETFGWIIVVCAGLGAMEGALCIVTARLALGTIPSRWIAGAWVTSIVLHALGMFTINVFVSALALQTFQYYVAFTTAGVLQIIAAILATLLPNEDDTDDCCDDSRAFKSTTSYSATGRNYDNYGYMRNTYGYGAGGGVKSGRSSMYKCQCHICSQVGCLSDCLPICAPKGSLSVCDPAGSKNVSSGGPPNSSVAGGPDACC